MRFNGALYSFKKTAETEPTRNKMSCCSVSNIWNCNAYGKQKRSNKNDWKCCVSCENLKLVPFHFENAFCRWNAIFLLFPLKECNEHFPLKKMATFQFNVSLFKDEWMSVCLCLSSCQCMFVSVSFCFCLLVSTFQKAVLAKTISTRKYLKYTLS